MEEKMKNEMILMFDAISENESLSRLAIAAFIAPLNPTLEEMSDVKTAVSEAVTNAIIHGYNNVGTDKKVKMHCTLKDREIHIKIEDEGVGIDDVEKAMEPLFTTKPELERSGMGFAFMEAFMDELRVESKPGQGTQIFMKKRIGEL